MPINIFNSYNLSLNLSDTYNFLSFLSWSSLVGFAVSAPIGPVGLLVIQKTLERGLLTGLLIGLSTSLVNVLFALMAVLGLSAISSFLMEQMRFIQGFGGLFLLYLAYREIHNVKKARENPKDISHLQAQSNIGMMIKVALLTLSNPVTIISFLSVFTVLDCDKFSTAESVSTILGIFIGSMLWWLLLSGIVKAIKNKVSDLWLERIKIISAYILVSFGLFLVFKSCT